MTRHGDQRWGTVDDSKGVETRKINNQEEVTRDVHTEKVFKVVKQRRLQHASVMLTLEHLINDKQIA